ncbi:ribonuclease HII [Candidatus Woesearchaeota archaeon]|nr:ribonuclease HII [Candidatus Woesearchaeota archaeon]
MTTICGIDEAGRGSVIGPLVIAGVLINENDEQKLKEMGVKDSKLLTPKQREDLFDKVISAVKEYRILIIEPSEIDEAVLGPKEMNLNWLEADKSAEIINFLKPDKAILDCPSNNISSYKSYVLKKVKDVEIIAEHKADMNYPSVAAGSILAKVTRDREIEKIKAKIGADFGSGYPSDPLTAKFVEKNFKKYPEIFRKSWETFRRSADKKKQKKLGDF